MRRILPLFISVLIIFSFAQCGKKEDSPGLSEKQMIGLMADLEMAEGYSQTEGMNMTPGSKDRIIEYIIQKRGLSKEEFDSLMSWYGRNPDKYEQLFAKVDKELLNRRKKLAGKADVNIIENDLWPYTRHAVISKLSPYDNLMFTIKQVEFGKGSSLTWKMRFHGMPQGQIMLGVAYPDGSMAYATKTLTGRNNQTLSVQTDTAKKVERIFGMLKIEDRSVMPLFIDSITLHTEDFDSTQYYKINMLRKYKD